MYRYFLLLLFCSLCNDNFSQPVQITAIYCNEKGNPLGTGASPAFSWQLNATGKAVMQASWHIIVADNAAAIQRNEGNIWNSGIHHSAQSIHVTYSGQPLQPAKKYYWRVQVTDNKGHTAAWSAPGTFTTALFTTKDWGSATWIGYAQMPDSIIIVPGIHSPDIKRKLGPDKLKQRDVVPLFRKAFTIHKKIANATVFATGVGQYEMSINGKKVGSSFLSPGWTNYDKRVLYNVYDVTGMLQPGDNAIGMIVGNGFYNISRERYIKLAIAFGYPAMICKLIVNYTDGTSQVIVSDKSWKIAPSPITFTSIYGGEDYNAMLEQKGWDEAAFKDASWKPAIAVTPPKGILEAEQDYPVAVQDTLQVKTVNKPKDSVYVYDFGQNLSGIVELTVQGKKGQVIKLSPSELLNDKLLANQNNTGKPYYLSYTLKGDGIETWRPRFTYYGFRYVQVEGAVPDTDTGEGFAKLVSLHALHTRNTSPSNGSFSCSNELFNRINTLIQWAIKSNLQSVETDCPHREKLGWLEEDYLMGGSVNANYNIHLLYRKLVHDMMDAQTKEGMVPDIAPEFVFFDDNGFGFRDSPEWGSAAVIVPWLVYKWYGDNQLLTEAWPMMQRYVAYLKSRSNNNILDYGLGDWYDYGPKAPGVAQLTPKALTATAIYYYDIQLMHGIATLLHKKADALQYEAQASAVYKAFNDRFFDVKMKLYATGSQTAMAMPLSVGLVDSQYKAAVMQNMVDSITASGKKLTAGDIGFHFLVQALHDGGASQLIYDMNYRDDVAGYGYQLKKGATALTESWAALKEVSNNHLMLGHIMQWFYEGLGGIQQSDSSVAYNDIIIKPEIVGNISWVKTEYHSLYGNISTSWKKHNDRFMLDVTIPVNAGATIYLPANVSNTILEGDTAVTIAEGNTRLLGYTSDGRAMIRVGSGEYHFVVQ